MLCFEAAVDRVGELPALFLFVEAHNAERVNAFELVRRARLWYAVLSTCVCVSSPATMLDCGGVVDESRVGGCGCGGWVRIERRQAMGGAAACCWWSELSAAGRGNRDEPQGLSGEGRGEAGRECRERVVDIQW